MKLDVAVYVPPNKVDSVKRVLENTSRIEATGQEALVLVVTRGVWEAFQRLVVRGAPNGSTDPNEQSVLKLCK